MTISTPEAATLLSISAVSFRRIVKKKGISPVDSYMKSYYKTGPECPLWDEQEIASLTNDPDVIKTQQRRANQKSSNPEAVRIKRFQQFSRKYGSREKALKDVCDAMFSLNRHAKHRRCTEKHREIIYDLKSSLLRKLCAENRIDKIEIHTKYIPGKSCFRCDGSGFSVNGDPCDRCCGSGYYRFDDELIFYLFSLEVEGQRFSWHQPDKYVSWKLPFAAQQKGTDWSLGKVSAVPMPKRKFAIAKYLIRFYLLDETDP